MCSGMVFVLRSPSKHVYRKGGAALQMFLTEITSSVYQNKMLFIYRALLKDEAFQYKNVL